MSIADLTFLAHCFFRGALSEKDQEVRAFQHFLLAFSNPSHPLTRRSQYYLDREPWFFSFQIHLRHFAHVQPDETSHLASQIEGLTLHRQNAKISCVDHGRKSERKRLGTGNVGSLGEQHFRERVLSISLTMYEHGSFSLVIFGDKGVIVGAMPTLVLNPKDFQWSGRTLNPRGKWLGLGKFLEALAQLIEAWHHGWNEALDAIDDAVGFTVREKRLDDHGKTINLLSR